MNFLIQGLIQCGCELFVPCCWPKRQRAETVGDFPPEEKLWEGGDFKFLGSDIKYKKIIFVDVQIYRIALYVETESAKAELKRLQKEGFITDFSEESLCKALSAGKFRKLLQIQFLRSVTLSQFQTELEKDLKPRLEKTGDQGLLQPFFDFFKGKDLSYLSQLLALWEVEGVLTGGLFPPGFDDFADAKVTIGLPSENFCLALFDIYIGSDSITPNGRKKWAEAALELLKGP
eukprot:jgi/Botrbrau1/18493/Bobra.0072s0072.1